ncbi:hypothetical protein HHL19_36325 [Streptomyces sp. R302]|uniref:hypothetical protein n=1 Tax=unclassified Streptomyces TaxID=2593676 RepID=UPI00145D834E|nr:MULTISPECIES: hypothetical protein [unclassified Streptomyces]NML55680.1 hypothetical protein [Streptomyces sp. R301]NML83978.1 hypothetical protein [Streptomyces sp. R302]
MPESDPVSPFTTAATAAIQIHELYQSFVRAGFTEAQALDLVKHLMVNRKG